MSLDFTKVFTINYLPYGPARSNLHPRQGSTHETRMLLMPLYKKKTFVPRSVSGEQYGARARCSPVSNATISACLHMATPTLEPNNEGQAAPIPI